jgi:hypothetical protein
MAKKKPNEATGSSVPALVVTPDKAPVVSGNFQDIEAKLLKWKQRVLKMEMTEENMAEVKAIKKEAVAYRSSLTETLKTIKKVYFNDPKAFFEAQMDRLFAVVAEVEKATDEVLKKEEDARIAGINEVLDGYIKKFQGTYNLDDSHLARIERKKSYYNKTADEKERKDDIEQQFKVLKKEQDAYAANVRLIKATCKEEPRLNVQHWIEQLQYDDIATITEAIIAEKQRLRELDKQEAESRDTEPQSTTTFSSGSVYDVDCEVEEEAPKESETITLGIPLPILT